MNIPRTMTDLPENLQERIRRVYTSGEQKGIESDLKHGRLTLRDVEFFSSEREAFPERWAETQRDIEEMLGPEIIAAIKKNAEQLKQMHPELYFGSEEPVFYAANRATRRAEQRRKP